jgi:DNA-binding LacI/PurR family transcriptional regulator
VVLLNRPADATDAVHTVVAPDNVTITKDTVTYLIEQARKAAAPGAKVKAAILVGDLSDINAVGRRDGFDQAIAAANAAGAGAGALEVVASIPPTGTRRRRSPDCAARSRRIRTSRSSSARPTSCFPA